jgi:hypothetical protein
LHEVEARFGRGAGGAGFACCCWHSLENRFAVDFVLLALDRMSLGAARMNGRVIHCCSFDYKTKINGNEKI